MAAEIPWFALTLVVLLSNVVVDQTNLSMAKDTLVSSQSVSLQETLISASQIFELGFFTPPNTNRSYIGIWYKDITPKTIVWVGNRENPLSPSDDQSASLVLSNDGNLRLFNGNQSLIWSTNVTTRFNTSVIAFLSDAGDLILKESESEWILWQSFDYTCGVILTTMQRQVNTKAGEKLIMDTWRSEDDPSPGSFALGLPPEMPVQSYIWNGTVKHWRSGPWNGTWFVGIPYEKDVEYLSAWSIHQNNQTGVLYFATNQYDNSTINIMRLTPEGSLRSMVWDGKDWEVVWEDPGSICAVYGKCGKFGVCNLDKDPICSCYRGFVPNSPEEWSKGNWSDGCKRRTELLCSKNMSDGFWKLSRARVPDMHRFSASKDSEHCRAMCFQNCSCNAYAYVSGIGCMVWGGDLVDVQEFAYSGEDLFIRLAHSELVGNKNTVLILSVAIFLVIVTLLALFTYGIYRFKAKKRGGSGKLRFLKDMIKRSKEIPQEQLKGLKQVDADELPTFSFEELAAATNGFSEENKIGEGGFGTVFRGKLQQGQEIAVKRLSSHSHQGINELRNEILVISKLQHRNLVRIFGCCVQGEEQLIVYEYLPNSSLDTYLFDQRKKEQLNWALRVNIIQCIARGLSYLHLDSRLRVIHRDLKVSNVLLDHNMNPKISDFGLARTFQPTQDSGVTVRVVGTFGYMSPEYAMTGKFSEKSDVYSYGVLVLEIVSGRRNNSFSYEDEDLSLVTYAWRLWSNGRGQDMVDKSLGNSHCDEILRCIHVGLLCVQDHPNDRPTMSKVVLMLGSETPLIRKPKKPSFFSQSRSTCDHGSVFSKNEVTSSEVEGR